RRVRRYERGGPALAAGRPRRLALRRRARHVAPLAGRVRRCDRGAARGRPAADGLRGARCCETGAMKRALAGGFELDDDLDRIDVDEVCRFLSEESYWAKGRPRPTIERLIRESSRVVGLYHDGRQIGFARTSSDGVAYAYLADVYVLPEFRGRGLGVELVREAVDGSPFRDVRWLLHTADAHGLYRKLGFQAPS